MIIRYKYIALFITITFLTAVGVLTAKSTFTAERLKQSCYNYIESLVGKSAEISIAGSIRDQLFEESGITARCTGSAESFKGNCFVCVEFYQGSKLVKRLQIPARVRFYQETPIARNAIMGGSLIGSDDIKLEKREITNYQSKEIPILDDLIGKTARGNISKGSIITRSSIKEEPAVKRGGKVLIVVQAGAVRISSMGEALQDAVPGQSVRVKREGSQTILQGIAAMDGSVFINVE
jgi:flagella basal body P-ring formation protein FlgA